MFLRAEKDDRATIISDTMDYIRELGRTVNELKLLVEKKRRKKERGKEVLIGEELVGDMESSSVKPFIDEGEHHASNGSLRSSWLQRKSKETFVDVRIVEDEVTIKITQRKRMISCLLTASRILDELQLELLHLSGGIIGDCHIYMFNTKIPEGSSVYASAVAKKLIEVMDVQFPPQTSTAPSPSTVIPPSAAPSPSLTAIPQPPLPLPRQSSPCHRPLPSPSSTVIPPAPLPPLDCHPPAAAPSPSTAPEPVLGPIHTEGWNYSYVCDPERFTIMGLAVDDFVYCDNSQPYDMGDTAISVPRLGHPKYNWWSEDLHGVSKVGDGATWFGGVVPRATSFPMVISSAASFNETLWNTIGKVVSTEDRAMYNLGHSGLTFWSPNINVAATRDGEGSSRHQEKIHSWSATTPPTSSGGYKMWTDRKLQQISTRDLLSLKVSACCKHYTTYDLDNWKGVDRYHFDARVAAQDMEETFQRPFKMCVKDGDVSSVICIVSDCDSIEVIRDDHKWLNDSPEDAVAQSPRERRCCFDRSPTRRRSEETRVSIPIPFFLRWFEKMADVDTFLFTSESVNEGHPDKLCDQISDAVLDACLAEDSDSKVACETCTKTNMVMVFGEITTKANVDYEKIVRDTCRVIGFISDDVGLDADRCKVLVNIEQQSLKLHSHVLATKIGARLTEVRKNGTCPWLRPDGKTQVTVEYRNDHGAMVPIRVHTVLISTQHDETVTNDEIARDLKEHVIKPVIPEKYLDEKTIFHLNPSGRFVIGGPHGDAGLTGRRSSLTPMVDRSGAYIARQAAKSIVANGLARRCIVQVSYAIGVPEPLSVFVDTYGTGKIPDKEILKIVKENFDFRPGMIIINLDLKRGGNGRFLKTAAYGHFGRDDPDFTWEVVKPLKWDKPSTA
uniref:methionine adenosyltransferase n=1 Tax=Ananas comosus var. bracteatus TaxID=296719 RepID=A0A6V7PD66_ANACO|nr:unnamed protein product [Ananas comosus var. bracteatus]